MHARPRTRCDSTFFDVTRLFRLPLAVLLAAAPLVAAGSPARGWFWYQEPPPPPASAPVKRTPVRPMPVASKPAAARPAPPKPAASGPAFLSVEWLRKELPRYRDRAIDDPTPEHVAQYLALQKVMFDKAQNFAEASVKAREMYPGLSQAAFTPYDANSLMNAKYYEQAVRPFAFKQIFAHAGLMFFFDSTCQWCGNQWRQLKVFKVNVPEAQMMAVSADDKPLPGAEMPWAPNNGIIQTFGIKIYPTVALVWPPNHVALVAQGETDSGTLEANILNAAVDHGLLPKSYGRWIKPFEQGVLTPLDLKRIANSGTSPDDILKSVSDQSVAQYKSMDGPAP